MPGDARPARHGHRWAAPLLYLVLLAAFAAGVWGSHRALFPGPGLYRVTGVYQARWGEAMILVSHEAVPGLMEEMGDMAFMAESKTLVDRAGLARGDRVRLTVRQEPDRLLVVEIQKIR